MTDGAISNRPAEEKIIRLRLNELHLFKGYSALNGIMPRNQPYLSSQAARLGKGCPAGQSGRWLHSGGSAGDFCWSEDSYTWEKTGRTDNAALGQSAGGHSGQAPRR